MSLLEQAYRIYQQEEQRGTVGVKHADEKEPLAPISHLMTRAQIQITLNADGKFIAADAVAKDQSRTIIPVTIESAGRTSSAKDCPHPFSDQLMFFVPGLGGNMEKYLEQLTQWEESPYCHEKVHAVRTYVQNNTILSDLVMYHIVTIGADGMPDGGKLENVEYRKCMVRWIVLNTGDADEAWRDQSFFTAYSQYYESVLRENPDLPRGLCEISWDEDAVLSESHPKGVHPLAYGAKLISSNDSSGFTYRGRFRTPAEAASVGYSASQKAHNALRWLEVNQGVSVGNRRFLWTKPSEASEENWMDYGEFSGYIKTEPERIQNFQTELAEAVNGYSQNNLHFDETVLILAIEAATTGRLSVTYYNELGAQDFAKRLQIWYRDMAYSKQGFTPSIRQVILYAFGSQRGEFMETEDHILADNTQRLTQCVVDGKALPTDIVFGLVHHFSHPLNYNVKNLERLQSTTFSAVKKYRNDAYKEEWNLGLDKTCKDRSYLFGRLLAVADKLEADTYGDTDRRMTNAIRLQAVFAQHPNSTWRVLDEKLNPYKQRLMKSNSRAYFYYTKLIGEISSALDINDPRLNRPLDERYVLGYYHQYESFFEKKNKESTGEATETADTSENV